MKNVILLHGGAGGLYINVEEHTKRVTEYSSRSLKFATPLEVAIESVRQMEDDPEFNAGTGSVRRLDGSIQMDAAVIEPWNFGAVMNIERVRNPVLVARDVMLHSPHVILAGDGAIRFARAMGYADYDPGTEKTEEIWKKTKELLASDSVDIPQRIVEYRKYSNLLEKIGTTDTVGAVCRIDGKFAAAISTGGASPMIRGRVGDSPIPGSGLYAGDKGAVAVTGLGEEIIKRTLSFRIYSRIGEAPLKKILQEEISYFGESPTGVIAVSGTEHASYTNKFMSSGFTEF